MATGVLVTTIVAGCASSDDKLSVPTTLSAPAYEGGEPLLAVAPLRNESGTSLPDIGALTDQLVAQVGQVRGMRVVPLNRTLAAMRASEIANVDSPATARKLAEVMGVDGVIVGTLTAWDPYNPPKIGMNLALFLRPGSMRPALAPAIGADGKPLAPGGSPAGIKETGVDPVTLRTSAREPATPPREWLDRPAATASEHLDGANHAVQQAVKDYAEGRHETVSALGWRRYLASVRLYADFACYRMMDRLLDAERRRAGQSAPMASVEKQ